MAAATPRPIAITGDADADALLDRDPFSLLVGMLLDQQFPMERAFAGPARIAERLGVDHLEPAEIAAQEPEGITTSPWPPFHTSGFRSSSIVRPATARASSRKPALKPIWPQQVRPRVTWTSQPWASSRAAAASPMFG